MRTKWFNWKNDGSTSSSLNMRFFSVPNKFFFQSSLSCFTLLVCQRVQQTTNNIRNHDHGIACHIEQKSVISMKLFNCTFDVLYSISKRCYRMASIRYDTSEMELKNCKYINNISEELHEVWNSRVCSTFIFHATTAAHSLLLSPLLLLLLLLLHFFITFSILSKSVFHFSWRYFMNDNWISGEMT